MCKIIGQYEKCLSDEQIAYQKHCVQNISELTAKTLNYIDKTKIDINNPSKEYLLKLKLWVKESTNQEQKFNRMFIYDMIAPEENQYLKYDKKFVIENNN